MEFLNKKFKKDLFVDGVFSVSTLCKKDNDPSRINATIGSLYTEEEKLATYQTVETCEKELTAIEKAAYAPGIRGDENYLRAVEDIIMEKRLTYPHASIATAGGTGAIAISTMLCLDEGDEILLPETSWVNYRVIAENNGIKPVFYDLYDLDDLFAKIDSIKGKVFLLINSPCENPCGHEYTYEEWEKIIAKLNGLGKEAVILNDIAYIDYGGKKDYLSLFNTVNDNVLVCIAYSASKSFSYYGYRLGCLTLVHKDQELIERLGNNFMKGARGIWSSGNTGAMKNVANVLNNHLDEYLKEKDAYVALIAKRAKRFTELCNEYGLAYYPYSCGFFVTLKMTNERRDRVHQKLIEDHIYTIKVNKGIRIALCSIPYAKIEELMPRLKKVLEECA